MDNAAQSSHRVPTIAGSEAFIEGLESVVATPSSEVPRRERALKSLGAYDHEGPSRNAAIRAAFLSGNYTQIEIARYFGLHYTTVCRIVGNRSCRDAKKQDVTPHD
jgi:hypothetical protein